MKRLAAAVNRDWKTMGLKGLGLRSLLGRMPPTSLSGPGPDQLVEGAYQCIHIVSGVV